MACMMCMCWGLAGPKSGKVLPAAARSNIFEMPEGGAAANEESKHHDLGAEKVLFELNCFGSICKIAHLTAAGSTFS